MKRLKNVQGSKESSQELIIGKDTVYIHENIKKVKVVKNDEMETEEEIYEYDEIQMTKDEYLHFLQDKVEVSTKAMAEIMLLIGRIGGRKIMALFIATGIIEGLFSYDDIFKYAIYEKYQAEVNGILISEGRKDLIPEVSQQDKRG